MNADRRRAWIQLTCEVEMIALQFRGRSGVSNACQTGASCGLVSLAMWKGPRSKSGPYPDRDCYPQVYDGDMVLSFPFRLAFPELANANIRSRAFPLTLNKIVTCLQTIESPLTKGTCGGSLNVLVTLSLSS